MNTNLLPFENLTRTVIVKRKADSDPKYGGDPNNRSILELINYGIINIDKPKGPTSHQVSDYLQKILKISKAGHSGTLDPKVTGVLPIATGRATRIVETLLKSGKEYVGILHLHKETSERELMKVVKEFTGRIKQLPPIKSAVKREERYRKIYYLEILEFDGKDALFRVGCQAGTYIRKLCHDIGKKLGCGANMAELRRTKAGPFKDENLITLHDLTDAYWYFKNEDNEKYLRKVILPIENAVSHLAKIWVLDSTVDSVCHGSDLKVPGIARFESDIQPDDRVAIMTLKNELVALGFSAMTSADIIKKDKGIVIKVNKVFMLPGTYPRVQK
ncbi:MAG: RNA-guided pseudouridylation complex pseudouridine synthase subunit Cbf5 [Candidatus Woesearchaeota archaeon]